MGTAYHYFRTWKKSGVWTCVQREIYEQAREHAGRSECPWVVIMDGRSVKRWNAAERGFGGHKRIKGRKSHIVVDTLGLPIANRAWNPPVCRIGVRDVIASVRDKPLHLSSRKRKRLR